MSKYAPANVAGDKPYIVVGSRWGRDVRLVIYAPDAASARHRSGLRGTGEYVRSVRRALDTEVGTPEGGTDV